MADATIMGISTLGVTFGYGVETTAGQKPAAFTQLHRINNIGGITITPATIDASALEDLVTKTVAGRGETGGTWPVTVNYTPETLDEWQAVITAYQTAKAAGKNLWFETIIPGFDDGLFVVAQPPEVIPQPEIGQNELLTIEFPMIIVDPKGASTKVAFT